VLVGGGSYSWAHGVLSNFLGDKRLDGSHVVLHDLNPEPLALTYQLALKYKKLTGSRITFEQTTDQAAALDGADYVVVTISTGGLKTMRVDLEVPEKYGIFQTVGDTVGPGGLSRALRNVPVFVRMGQAMQKRCPNAWMLNISNPLCALTRAVIKETGAKVLGLCHGVLGVARHYAEFLGVGLDDCAYVNTGVDHCAWFSEFEVKGRCAQEMLIEQGIDKWLAKPPAEAKEDKVFGSLFSLRCGLMLWRQFGALPAIGDRHIVEFFPTFLQGMDNVARYGLVRTTIADREGYYREGRARLERLLSGEEKLHLREASDVVGERQSDDISAWIVALDGGRALEDNLNAPNIGQIPELPKGAIVETRGVLDGTGFRPLVSPLPKQLIPVVLPTVVREELTVEAAVEGSFEKALAALASDPLVDGIETARPLLEEMLAANKDWLPQFKV
jgi:alpha-galactosidase